MALGEIGLDYHYDEPPKETQKAVFIRQLELAKKLDVPVIIHNRDSDGEMMDILKKYDLPLLMHCFSSSNEIAKLAIKRGYYISLAGTVTFKNARSLHEIAQTVPLEKLLIETDCPYLTPEPYRGKRNYPALVGYTAMKIAELRGITVEEVAKITYDNAVKFYRIK